MLRTAVVGPDPLNTLVYLECDVPGAVGGGQYGTWIDVNDQFQTEFRLDGFQQQNHDWYVANTLVSAAPMLRWFTTTTDFRFSGGLNELTPSISQLDGTLGFSAMWSIYVDDEAWFPESGNSIEMSYRISAYVLCYEPRTEPPPGGKPLPYWGRITDTTVSRRRHPAFRPAEDGFSMTVERPKPPAGSEGEFRGRPPRRRSPRRPPQHEDAADSS